MKTLTEAQHQVVLETLTETFEELYAQNNNQRLIDNLDYAIQLMKEG